MKAKPILLALLAVGSLAAWVPAALADEPKTISANDLREVIKTLDPAPKEDKDDEGKSFWLIKTKDDVKFLVFQYGGKGDEATSISASAAYSSGMSASDMNDWNASHRYYKLFSTDKGVMLESDLDVSVAPSKAVVKKFLNDFAVAAKKFQDE